MHSGRIIGLQDVCRSEVPASCQTRACWPSMCASFVPVQCSTCGCHAALLSHCSHAHLPAPAHLLVPVSLQLSLFAPYIQLALLALLCTVNASAWFADVMTLFDAASHMVRDCDKSGWDCNHPSLAHVLTLGALHQQPPMPPHSFGKHGLPMSAPSAPLRAHHP